MRRLLSGLLLLVVAFSFVSVSEARYYDASTGRFISEDPSGFEGGDVNLYAYVQNNPVNYTDPYGLNPVAFALAGGSIAGPAGAVVGLGIDIIGGQILWDNVIQPWFNSDNLPTPPSEPSQSPGEGWEWKGKDPPGGRRGSWHNPGTGESLHPDLNHPPPIGPHWDYTDPQGKKHRLPCGS